MAYSRRIRGGQWDDIGEELGSSADFDNHDEENRGISVSDNAEDDSVFRRWRLENKRGADDVRDWYLAQSADKPLLALPPIPSDIGYPLPEHPFLGLASFGLEESRIFFGRGQAIYDLYQKVTDPSPSVAPIILLCGPTGVGKSSLLAAGLIPRLVEENEVVFIERPPEQGLLAEIITQITSTFANVQTTNWTLAQAWHEHERQAGDGRC